MGRHEVGGIGRRRYVQRVLRRYCVIMGNGSRIVWRVVGEHVHMLKGDTKGTALCVRSVLPVLTRKGDTRGTARFAGQGVMFVLILQARASSRVSYATLLCAVSMWRSAVRVWIFLPVFTTTGQSSTVFVVRLIWRAKRIPQSMCGTAVRTTSGR